MLVFILIGYALGQVFPVSLFSVSIQDLLSQITAEQFLAFETALLVGITGYYAWEVARQTRISAANSRMPVVHLVIDIILAPLNDFIKRSKIELLRREEISLYAPVIKMISESQPSLTFHVRYLFSKIDNFALSYSQYTEIRGRAGVHP
ncbi:hypothetical protein HYR53_03995 [Candidatus Acetothermia bacterium]|nr:hypothetical protein [Candidatus Acetothermia bacterium]